MTVVVKTVICCGVGFILFFVNLALVNSLFEKIRKQ